MIFFLTLMGGIVMFVLGLIRFTFNNIAAVMLKDGRTAYRHKKDFSIAKMFAFAVFLLYLATRFAA